MINDRTAERYCCEDISKIANYDKAVADTTQTWHCHHKLEMFVSMLELIDSGRYYKVPARELVFLTPKEHRNWPHKGREEANQKMSEAMSGENHPFFGKHHSEETRERISKANIGKRRTLEQKKRISASKTGENHPLFGKHLPEETRKKMSKAHLGKRWWNNGTKCIMAKECPEGFVPGRLKKLLGENKLKPSSSV